MDEQKDLDSGSWVLVTAAAKNYIGRVTHVNGTSIAKQVESSIGFVPRYDEVPAEVLTGATRLTLNPSFDYMLSVGQYKDDNGETVMGRRPLLMALDLTEHPCPAHLSNITCTILFAQMHEEDRKNFRAMVSSFIAQREASRKARSPIAQPDLGNGDGLKRTKGGLYVP